MKYPILAFLLFTSHAFGDELKPGFYPAAVDGDTPTAEAIWDLEKEADRVVWHDEDKIYDIALEKVTDGTRSPTKLNSNQIKDFLAAEKHKVLIVVYFDKTVMRNEDEFVSARAREVTSLMLGIGYDRVVVLGAHSSGVHYIDDTNLYSK